MRRVLNLGISPLTTVHPSPVVQVTRNFSPGEIQVGPMNMIPNFSQDPVPNTPGIPVDKAGAIRTVKV